MSLFSGGSRGEKPAAGKPHGALPHKRDVRLFIKLHLNPHASITVSLVYLNDRFDGQRHNCGRRPTSATFPVTIDRYRSVMLENRGIPWRNLHFFRAPAT
jgi:hypothetical protein